MIAMQVAALRTELSGCMKGCLRRSVARQYAYLPWTTLGGAF